MFFPLQSNCFNISAFSVEYVFLGLPVFTVFLPFDFGLWRIRWMFCKSHCKYLEMHVSFFNFFSFVFLGHFDSCQVCGLNCVSIQRMLCLFQHVDGYRTFWSFWFVNLCRVPELRDWWSQQWIRWIQFVQPVSEGYFCEVLLQARGYELVMFPSKGKVPLRVMTLQDMDT